uniref:NADH-ubiquinone oxidoreductase chain 5 n=1 Tax=Emplectonema gracile TaxID=6230 RepID=H6BCH4_9BILA|nr:NADH dehydrogenase subunit 5 [Emplectonema gracile]AEC12114.1 NADH dehydrogenase subunit 5 [Emplectonema gracile]
MFFWKNLSISLFISFFILYLFFLFFFVFVFFIWDCSSLLIDWQILCCLGFDVCFSILIDWVSLSFCLVVFCISFSVIWFSYYYMYGDQYVFRFSWLVVLFVASMIFLIFIPNLISLLLGWDGLGLISFCLVVYYQNFKSLVSGMVTVLMNRVGDVMILLSIGWLISLGSWNFLFLSDFYMGSSVGLCLVMAGMTKSAQFPFCSWLPAAMAAPTPVSALVHSSTLVTAGVFLIIRFWEFIFLYENVVFFLQLISLLTMVLSGFSAVFESDLKKVIALSTLSQLSVMLFSVSFGFSFLGLFHLYTHALFKALLFLCAGCLIHSFFHVQDVRSLGSCWSVVPCTMFFLNLANLALCGFPFLGGFFSKDMILEMFLWEGWNFLFFSFLFLGTALTVAYSVRLSLFSLLGVSKMGSFLLKGEEDLNFLIPMLVLGSGTLFGGFFFYVFIFEPKCMFFFASVMDKNFIFLVLFFGFFLGVIFFYLSWPFFKEFSFFKMMSEFGAAMWFLQILSAQGFLSKVFNSSFFSFYSIDRGYFEYFGGQGVLKKVSLFSSNFVFFSSKSVVISSVFILLFSFLFFF